MIVIIKNYGIKLQHDGCINNFHNGIINEFGYKQTDEGKETLF